MIVDVPLEDDTRKLTIEKAIINKEKLSDPPNQILTIHTNKGMNSYKSSYSLSMSDDSAFFIK